MILFPTSPTATVVPGSTGFPVPTTGQPGSFFNFADTYLCNVYANNVSSVNAVLTYVDARGHQTQLPLNANSPFQIENVWMNGFRVTGNGATLAVIVSAPTGNQPPEKFNPQYLSVSGVVSQGGSQSIGGTVGYASTPTVLYTCNAGQKAYFLRAVAEDSVNTGTLSLYIVPLGFTKGSGYNDFIANAVPVNAPFSGAYSLYIGMGTDNGIGLAECPFLLPGDTLVAQAGGTTSSPVITFEMYQEPL